MFLTCQDKELLNESIRLIKEGYNSLLNLDATYAVKNVKELSESISRPYHRKDAKDTNVFDMTVEKVIGRHGSAFDDIYGEEGVVVTEERGKIGRARIEENTPVIISDPVDRSSYLEHLLKAWPNKIIGDIYDEERKNYSSDVQAWQESPNSSVTFLKDSQIKYSLILSHTTGELFLASPEHAVLHANINNVNDYHDFKEPVEFKQDAGFNLLCFTLTGKDGLKNKYELNREGTNLRYFNLLDRSFHGPPGPARWTNLVYNSAEDREPVHAIAHNGEKIQESLPNVAVALFSDGKLGAYKLFCDPHYLNTRVKVLTPNLQSSIYDRDGLVTGGIRLSFLNNNDYPSEFRDTTVVVARANDAATTLLDGMTYQHKAIRLV